MKLKIKKNVKKKTSTTYLMKRKLKKIHRVLSVAIHFKNRRLRCLSNKKLKKKINVCFMKNY